IDAIDTAAADLVARGVLAELPAPTSASAPSRVPVQTGQAKSVLALSPTSLAQPAWRGVAALARPFVERAPAWVTSRRALYAASGVGALLLVVVVGVARGGRISTPPGGTLAGSVYAPPPAPPDPKVDEVVAAAQAKLDQGDYAGAIDPLQSIEKKNADRSDIHMFLERAYAGLHDGKDSLREAALWLDTDSNASADPKLQEEIRNAALVRDTQDDAFAMLEAKMATRGIDILYDIGYGTSGRQYPQAASRARHSFDSQDVRSRASPALSILLDFRDAKSCEAKRALLDRARDQGDGRLVSTLQQHEAKSGCGFLGVLDCYGCLHRDRQLHDTIVAIQERTTKSP
ncbi:MAG: hypothetical protein ACRENE_30165, partial [Polyangiaceae bacterium]